jgi:hypothetical protein
MAMEFDQIYLAIKKWAKTHGIEVDEKELTVKKAGEFNGVTVKMNNLYTPEDRTYYLAHSLGSIVRWSLSHNAVQQMFDNLRAAKKGKEADPTSLERAIEAYRAFEIESSEFAVWLLNELGGTEAVPSYTNFMRADLEALTEFHRIGQAPVWRDFFAHWNEEVAQGRREVPPFRPKPIPPFQPVHIENQEILQEQ